jgi:hypothetical protein
MASFIATFALIASVYGVAHPQITPAPVLAGLDRREIIGGPLFFEPTVIEGTLLTCKSIVPY